MATVLKTVTYRGSGWDKNRYAKAAELPDGSWVIVEGLGSKTAPFTSLGELSKWARDFDLRKEG